jgi:hypothetical protein
VPVGAHYADRLHQHPTQRLAVSPVTEEPWPRLLHFTWRRRLTEAIGENPNSGSLAPPEAIQSCEAHNLFAQLAYLRAGTPPGTRVSLGSKFATSVECTRVGGQVMS